MIKKNTFKKFAASILTLLAFLYTFSTNAQSCPGNQITLTLANITATVNTIEYDVFLKNTGTSQLKFSGYGGNVLYDANLLPPGATGTLEVVDQPSPNNFPGIAANTVNPNHTPATRQLRWTFVPLIARASAPILASNVNYKFARFRFTSSIPWDLDTVSSLVFSTNSTGGVSLNTPIVYCNQNFASTSITLSNGTLILNIGGVSGGEGATINFRLLSNIAVSQSNPIIAFPNPFGESFKLKSDINSTDLVTVKVYDMLGKIVEQRQTVASELSKQELGISYQTGLYNVMVLQGNHQQTIRVIKK